MSSEKDWFKSKIVLAYDNKTRFRKSRVSESETLKADLAKSITILPKHELEELTTTIRKEYVRRFKRRKTRKYGSLSKAFTESQVRLFFKVIENDKFRLLFSYQAQLGLRIGEVVRVNIKHINFNSRELTLKTEKARTLDTLLIPMQLFKDTLAFISSHKAEIEASNGYVFFREAKHSNRAEPFLEQNYVRKAFRHYVRLADLDEIYEVSEESIPDRAPRTLHRLTTHSLRHYAITSFAKQTNGNVVLTSRFARHSDPYTTMVYITTKKEELYKEIDNAFSVAQADKLKRSIASKSMERNSTRKRDVGSF